MSNKKNPNVADIADIRVEIGRVDNLLLDLITKRLELTGQVRQAKNGIQVWRPSREHSLIRHLSEATNGTPPILVARIWAELMSASFAIKDPMRLHLSLEGDAIQNWSMVRDRFGAALPRVSYPTTSAALAAAYAEEEGVAVIPAPGGMQRWWTSLCTGGAMDDMNILAGLPRVGDGDWPEVVAVATADILPSGDDLSLLTLCEPSAVLDAGLKVSLRAETGDHKLLSIDGFIDPDGPEIRAIKAKDKSARIIGAIARSLPLGS